jgi:multicomponent Na+:H+ antiporter subunit C
MGINAISIGIIVFVIGLYGVMAKDNLVKKVMGLSIMNSGVVLFFIGLGYRKGGQAPIMEGSTKTEVVDPLPQALMLTAIVIGVSITTLALTLVMKLYSKYKTLSLRELSKDKSKSKKR